MSVHETPSAEPVVALDLTGCGAHPGATALSDSRRAGELALVASRAGVHLLTDDGTAQTVRVVNLAPDEIEEQHDLLTRHAEVVVIDCALPVAAHRVLSRIRELTAASGRPRVPVLASFSVLLADTGKRALARLAELDAAGEPFGIDFVGTGWSLVRHVELLQYNGFDGVHLRPAAIVPDGEALLRSVLPKLVQPPVGPVDVRERLGLASPALDRVGA